ncbi:MAG: O-succinylhomoserine sulfhydrylase [Pseudomonadales bacterium]
MQDKTNQPREPQGLETLGIRAGYERTAEDEHSEALFNTSSYVFSSAAEAAARFSGDSEGNVYSRYTNPTVRTFEQRIAALEGAESAVATSSGMAAILATCMALLRSGDHVLCSNAVFGSTIVMLNKYFVKMGVEVTYVPLTDNEKWRSEMRGNTRLLLMETPSNPLNDIGDLAFLAELAKQHGAKLVVDNSFCTPVLQRPLELGADIVTYAATKYLDGQGRCLGGVVLGNKEDMAEVLGFVRAAGPTMAPFNAWVFLKGLETLQLRMNAHCQAAQQLAEWLNEHEGVANVYYAGLPDHPGHDLAQRQQSGFGGVVSFDLDTPSEHAREQAWAFIDQLKLISHTANLGDVKSTVVHPATTTHSRLTDDERAGAGIGQGLIRISVGLETLTDIKADLQAAFDTVR